MKTRSFFMLSLAVMAMSCAKEVLPENNPENNPEENVELKLVPMEFTTALETKAGIVDGEGTVEWAANDQITVFDNLGGKNTFTTAVGGATSVFTGKVTEGATAFYALYPQRTSTASVLLDSDNEVINSKLFPNQTAVLGSYAKGNGGAVMVAKADAENRLYFKNMTSHIRFTLAEDMTDVKSITLMGNNHEILAGTYKVDFSGAEPVLTVDKAETYVTLSNGNGPLAPGDYFFTILPVEFEAGFTVILSKTDGTQVAKKTTKEITSLKTRNQVLPMAALPSSAYESHMNYFVKYNDGFDITFGGYTINNTTQTNAVRLTPTSNSITKDGFYFVPSSVAATIDYNSSSLILIGEDSSQRSAIVQNKTAQPNTTDGIFLCANLHYTLTRIETNTKVGTFDKIIFDNCKIINTGDGFLRLNNGAVVINDFVVSGCDIEIQNPKGAFNFVTGNQTGTKIVNTNFYNNVFYVNSTVGMTGFVLLNEGNAGTVKYSNIILSYNTFDKTPIGNAMVYATTASDNVSINYNVFLEANITAGLKYVMGTTPTKVSVENNFFYKGDYTKGVQIYKDFPGNNPKSIDDPRVSNWNPALGICSLNTITYNSNTFTAGAQREAVASSETANYAAANYVSVDYGTL
ncbi:MAG: hypothetical protein J6A91_04025 [Bacteroidales bacterium]|nr:hypothetical protein [Bacteroidales bacterium]